MKKKTIHIQNMCCQRCIDAVADELNTLKLKVESLNLGITTFLAPDGFNYRQLELALNNRGFKLIETQEEILNEKIRICVYEFIKSGADLKYRISFSKFLEDEIKLPFRTISKEFKKQNEISIEKYFIMQKIERAKEFLKTSNMQLSAIAELLGYRSLQHLSNQFKSIAGVSMLQYRKSPYEKRIPIDKI